MRHSPLLRSGRRKRRFREQRIQGAKKIRRVRTVAFARRCTKAGRSTVDLASNRSVGSLAACERTLDDRTVSPGLRSIDESVDEFIDESDDRGMRKVKT